MKSALVCLVLIGSLFWSADAVLAGLSGDVNGDGKVDIAEAIYALQVAAGQQPNLQASCDITVKGDWQQNHTYYPCEVVNYDGSFYIFTSENSELSTTPPPSSPQLWVILALKGEVDLSVTPQGVNCSPSVDASQIFRDELASKNHVFIPAGMECLIGQVDLNSWQSISGPGTIVKASAAPYALQVVGGAVSIKGVTFRPENASGQPNCDIKLGDGSRNVLITDNFFVGSSYSAVCAADDSGIGGTEYVNHAEGVLVTNNNFFGYVRPLFFHSVDNLTIQGNVIEETARDAIRLRENDGYVIINGNQFINIGSDLTYSETQDAVDTAWSGNKLIISDNIIRKTEMMAFDIKEVSADGASGSRSVIIANNHVSETYGSGLVIYGDDNGTYANYSLLVEGNIFENGNRAEVMGEAAIRVRGGGKYVTLANNHVLFNKGRGITVQNEFGGITGVKITGNTIINNGQNVTQGARSYGLIVSGVDSAIITDNIVANDTSLANPYQEYGIGITSTSNLLIRDNLVRCHPSGQVPGQIFIDNSAYSSADNLTVDLSSCP